MNDKKLYVNFQVTVSETKFSMSSSRGEAELDIEVLPAVLENLDAGNILKTMLPTALADYRSKLEEKEGEE